MDYPSRKDASDKPVPLQESKQPAEPASDTREEVKEEETRWMRWPADFPAKH